MRTEEVISPVVAGMGYELVDLQASNGGRLLRLFIDRDGGVGVEDCAAVSRQLARVLERPELNEPDVLAAIVLQELSGDVPSAPTAQPEEEEG